MISKGKRRAIITICIIFWVLCMVVSFLIGAQGAPSGGYINIFSLIIPLIGAMQFEIVMFVLVIKKGKQSAKPFLNMSLRTQMLITGGLGAIFIVVGLVIDAYHLPSAGGPYISSYGNFWLIVGCIYLAMIVGIYIREKMSGQVYN